MASLHVHDVPEELYERLRQRAEAENHPLSDEVIRLLEEALSRVERSPAQILEGIRRRRSSRPVVPDAPDSVVWLREDRER